LKRKRKKTVAKDFSPSNGGRGLKRKRKKTVAKDFSPSGSLEVGDWKSG